MATFYRCEHPYCKDAPVGRCGNDASNGFVINYHRSQNMATIKDVIVRKPNVQETANCKSWPIWTCDISRFDWSYNQTETCLILEGTVTVTDTAEPGQSVSFGPGDMVVFPVGLDCNWNVTSPVKKHYNFS